MALAMAGVFALGVLGLPSGVWMAAGYQVDRVEALRQWFAARAQGNVDAAVAMLSDDVSFIEGTCLVRTPCRGTGAVRSLFARQAADHAADTLISARAFGSVVGGRIQSRSNALRAAGVERVMNVFIAQVPQGKISGYAVLPDLTDPQTVRAELGQNARPVPVFADRPAVDRKFFDVVERGDVDTAVGILELFIVPGGCLPPCGPAEIRKRIQANVANHVHYKITNAQEMGSVVFIRFELRLDNIRAKGVERVVNVYIAQVPRGKIEAWIQFPDLADPDTAKFWGP